MRICAADCGNGSVNMKLKQTSNQNVIVDFKRVIIEADGEAGRRMRKKCTRNWRSSLLEWRMKSLQTVCMSQNVMKRSLPVPNRKAVFKYLELELLAMKRNSSYLRTSHISSVQYHQWNFDIITCRRRSSIAFEINSQRKENSQPSISSF